VTAVPYDWGEAKAAISRASIAQKNAEQAVVRAYKDYGEAERAYRMALAKEIVKLRVEGQPVTIVQDLARGAKHVADLRYYRDVAKGVQEATSSAVWRHTADRRELEQLVQWSMRVAPDGQHEPLGVA
jgi:hypothetical protein